VRAPSARPDPDPALISRAKEGDRGALKALLEEVSPPVRQWALAHTGDPDEAADLVQEVLILLVRKLQVYRGESRFLTWLYAVTRNQAIEAHRKRGRQLRKMEHFTAKGSPGSSVPPAQDSRIDEGRVRELVTGFLTELPQRQREVFQMAELQGLSSQEIGEVLGLGPGGVRAALFKARRTLRKRILAHHPEFVEEYLR
jgi:RNA polymerase sigma-70 factor (ECF subfamily)